MFKIARRKELNDIRNEVNYTELTPAKAWL